MRNHEISKILIEAGIKEHKLWDKPRPKWTDYDFVVLDCIRRNVEVEKQKFSEFSIDRKVERLSDRKRYDSVKLAAIDNNVGLNQIYDHCNGIKEIIKFTYVYEKKVQRMAENTKDNGLLLQKRS